MDDLNTTPTPTGGATLDDILARLVRIEGIIMADRLEKLEGREGTEGDDEEESNDADSAPSGALSEALSFAAATIAPATAMFAGAAKPAPAAVVEAFIDRLGFPHFKGSEFTPYWSRVRNGVKNSAPPEELWKNIVPTLAVLERFRTEFGSPVTLLSTYRSPKYNKAVGGAAKSQHEQFSAIDFTCRTGKPKQWAELLRSFRGKQFQNPHTGESFTFRGGVGIYVASHFVHVDTRGKDADWTG
jgi:hypothetical protein